MSAPQELLDDVDYVKGQIMSSDMSEAFKRRYNNLLNIATMATNGLSPEEKIQKMTESIAMLAETQAMYMIEINSKIKEQIKLANTRQCAECRAMKHTEEYEQRVEDEERWRKYLIGRGIDPDKQGDEKESNSDSWNDVLKTILTKPYIYIVFGLMSISPFGVEIVKAIMQMCGK